jgi:hypothetical protein
MTRRILGRSNFFAAADGVFCWGFWGKRRFRCGDLMVGSWRCVVSLWFAGGAFFVVGKSDKLLRFIFDCVGLDAEFEAGSKPMS